MGKRVFISGPIQGIEDKQRYRDKISMLLKQYGYEPVDPWQREKILYRGPPENWWSNVPRKDFIQRDLEDIDKCDILVAYMPRLSAGTCMELFFAKIRGKRTVTICRIKDPSPWIVEYSDILLKTIKDFEKILKRGF